MERPGLLAVLTAFCFLAARVAAEDAPTAVSLSPSGPTTIARCNIGTVDLRRTPQITHDFRLRNDGKAPFEVQRFQPSCHCTSAEVVPGGGLPTLAPGQSVSVRVTVALEPSLAGPLDKFVDVYGYGASRPAARLEIVGTVRVTPVPPARGR